MRKFILLILAGSSFAIAQQNTGINTTNSLATLEIVAKTPNTTNELEGLLIPRVSKQKALLMAGNMPEESMMIYINDLSDFVDPTDGTQSTVAKITENGYYHWDGTEWDSQIPQLYSAGLGIDITTNEISRTGLEEVTENGKTGWRLIGSEPTVHSDIGTGAIVLSEYSIDPSIPTGDYAFVGGNGSMASGENSFAFGDMAIASGDYSFALGWNAVAEGFNSLAFGDISTTTVDGNNAVALSGGEAAGSYSLAFGRDTSTTVDGSNAVAFSGGTASGDYSFAFGLDTSTTVDGSNAVAFSGGTASGDYSFAFGQESTTTVDGYNAVAFSGGTAEGENSFAFGPQSYASNHSEIALGKNFSTDTAPDPSISNVGSHQLFSVGYDLQNAIVTLRNAHTGIGIVSDSATPENSKPTEMLDVNGNVRVRGAVKIDDDAATFITDGDSCTEPGSIVYSDSTFYGCAGNVWKKLHN